HPIEASIPTLVLPYLLRCIFYYTLAIMRNWFRIRREFFVTLLKQRIGLKTLGTVWVVCGYFTFFRDDIWMPQNDQPWKVRNMLLAIPVWMWIGISLLFSLYWVFEAALKHSKMITEENARLKRIDDDD